MKVCTKCKIEKDESEFSKDKHNHTGYKSHCKLCCNKRYNDNSSYFVQYREDTKLHRTEYDKEYHLKNKHRRDKEEKAKYDAEYRVKNKDKRKSYNKLYNFINRHKIAKSRRDKYRTDPLYALSSRTRRLICISITNGGFKKSSKTEHILGCSFEEFKIHLETLFQDGMSWDNRSLWHIDHIYPVSKATSEEHLIELNHYTNLQPLWAEDNLKKSNKLPENILYKY